MDWHNKADTEKRATEEEKHPLYRASLAWRHRPKPSFPPRKGAIRLPGIVAHVLAKVLPTPIPFEVMAASISAASYNKENGDGIGGIMREACHAGGTGRDQP